MSHAVLLHLGPAYEAAEPGRFLAHAMPPYRVLRHVPDLLSTSKQRSPEARCFVRYMAIGRKDDPLLVPMVWPDSPG